MLVLELDLDRLKKCSHCGGCYDICPSSVNLPGYDPRAVIRDILAGDFEKWLTHKSIWQCLECHYCLEICYQHYGFESAMTAMRTIASKRGLQPEQVKRGWNMFVKTSKLGDPAMPARKKFGLPEPSESGVEEFRVLYELVKGLKGPAEPEEPVMKTEGED